MIEIARKNLPNGIFEVADIEIYNLPKNIDLIFSFASLLHSEADKVKNIIDDAYNSLHEGGVFYISLKYGNGMVTKTDRLGTRTYYLYSPDDIEIMAGNKYKILWSDTQEMLDQEWFTIALKKV